MEYRMYVLVERHLSPIDKGIQAAHAIASYSNVMEHDSELKEQYKKWCNEDKTIILLNGGTVKDLKYYMDEMSKLNISYSYFKEPDLDNIVTAIAILVDERVFNKEKYVDYQTFVDQKVSNNFFILAETLKSPEENALAQEWLKHIGGIKTAFLRGIFDNKKLAR